MENEIVKEKSKNKNLHPLVIIVFVILIFYTVTVFALLIWGFLTSFKSTDEFLLRKPANILGFPDLKWSQWAAGVQGKEYHLYTNYVNILKNFTIRQSADAYYSALFDKMFHVKEQTFGFGNYIFNSIFYSLCGSLVYSFVCMTAAYMCCKYKYKFSGFIYTMLLVIMTIPIVGNQPATIQVLRDLGLYNNYLGMLIMNMNMSGLYFFVFYAFFQGVPDTYVEAAEIDGASQLRTYISIIVPLAAKTLGTVFLIQFIALWNNYDAPLLYFPAKPTLAYAMYHMSISTDGGDNRGIDFQHIPQRVAGCMILAIPVLIVFLVLKDKIMGNMSLGGLKE